MASDGHSLSFKMADVRTEDISPRCVYNNWTCIIVAKFFLRELSDTLFEPNNLKAIHSIILR